MQRDRDRKLPQSDCRSGEVCFWDLVQALNVTPRTLRHYEYVEIMASRRKNGQRYYDRRAQARLKLALRARRLGMRLEDVRLWLNVYDKEGMEAQLENWLEVDFQLREKTLKELDGCAEIYVS